jgi:ankyrin repeat protein
MNKPSRSNTMNPITNAIANNDMESAKALLKIGIATEPSVLLKTNVLKNTELLRALIESRSIEPIANDSGPINVDYHTGDGYTALHKTTYDWNDLSEAFQILIDAGADVNMKANGSSPGFYVTPLSKTIAYGYTSAALALLKKGADPAYSGINGRPLICIATMLGYYELIQPLIDAGADVNGGSIHRIDSLVDQVASSTPLIITCCHVNGADCGSFWKSDPSRRNNQNNLKIAEILLKNGADTGIVDSKGRTALEIAKHTGFTEVAELIANHITTRERKGTLAVSLVTKWKALIADKASVLMDEETLEALSEF